MPRTMTQSQIMQSAGDGHHQVAEVRLPVAQLVFDDPAALHAAHRVLDPHLFARYATIFFFLLLGQLTTTRLLPGLLNLHLLRGKSLKSPILVEHTPCRKHIHFFIRKRLVMPSSGIGCTQKADLTLVIDHQDVLDRMALLLATVIFSLFVAIYWALDRTFGAIMIKKGASSSSGLSLLAMAEARRAGMTSRLSRA